MTYHLTAHAVDRYQERVKPALTFDAAKAEVERLVELAEFTTVEPGWTSYGLRPPDGWLIACDSIAFPVMSKSVLTCITRSGIGDEARKLRTARKKAGRGREVKGPNVGNDLRRLAKSRKPSRRLADSLFASTEDSNEMAAAVREHPAARPRRSDPS